MSLFGLNLFGSNAAASAMVAPPTAQCGLPAWQEVVARVFLPGKGVLDLRHAPNLSSFVQSLKDLQGVKAVKLEKTGLSPNAVYELIERHGPNLSKLLLKNTPYKSNLLTTVLESSTSLQTLYFGVSPYVSSSKAKEILTAQGAFSEQKELKKFTLDYQFDVPGIKALINELPPTIESLSLNTASVSTNAEFSELLQHIATRYPDLKELSLPCSNVQESLSSSSTLVPVLFKKLENWPFGFCDAHIENIMNMPNIKSIALCYNTSLTTLKDVQNLLANKTGLVSISIGLLEKDDCSVGEEMDFSAIAPLIIQNNRETLRELNFYRSIFSTPNEQLDPGLKLMIDSGILSQLRQFGFAYADPFGKNSITQANLLAIIEALGENLESFHMPQNLQISEQALFLAGFCSMNAVQNALIEMGKRCPKLKELSLAGWIFANDSNRPIESAFPNLRKLSLRGDFVFEKPGADNSLLLWVDSTEHLNTIDLRVPYRSITFGTQCHAMGEGDLNRLKVVDPRIGTAVNVKVDASTILNATFATTAYKADIARGQAGI